MTTIVDAERSRLSAALLDLRSANARLSQTLLNLRELKNRLHYEEATENKGMQLAEPRGLIEELESELSTNNGLQNSIDTVLSEINKFI